VFTQSIQNSHVYVQALLKHPVWILYQVRCLLFVFVF